MGERAAVAMDDFDEEELPRESGENCARVNGARGLEGEEGNRYVFMAKGAEGSRIVD